jgi:hypothetical protein
MFRTTAIALFCLAFSSLAFADEGEHEHHGHHGDRYYGPAGGGYYGRAPQYAPPPPPRFYSNDQRSHQGLAGGVVGSVLGYELGGGNPIISGLGAAAGSFLGNGMTR